MPMLRKLYPKDWEAISLRIRSSVDCKCERCDRPCRKPNEKVEDLEKRLREEGGGWKYELYQEIHLENGEWIRIARPQRFTLTVAHLDHVPGNCERENLRAWCAACHLRYDNKHRQQKREEKREAQKSSNQLGIDLWQEKSLSHSQVVKKEKRITVPSQEIAELKSQDLMDGCVSVGGGETGLFEIGDHVAHKKYWQGVIGIVEGFESYGDYEFALVRFREDLPVYPAVLENLEKDYGN